MKNSSGVGSKSYLLIISFIASLGGLLFGYDVIVVSGVIPQVVAKFQLSASQLGFLVSSVLLGCAVGSVVSGLVIDVIGRKKTIVLSSIIILLSAFWCSLATSFSFLLTARMLGGIGCGIATAVCPVYISEVSPEDRRGRMVTLYHFAVCLGIVFCVFINWAIFLFSEAHINVELSSTFFTWILVDEYWRAMFAAEAVPAFLFFIASFILPESPRWLVQHGYTEKAETILKHINGNEKGKLVCADIQDVIRAVERISFVSLFTSVLRKPLLLGVMLCVFSEACGISAVLYYGPRLFEQSGLRQGSSLGGFAILAVINLIFNFVAMRYVDLIGRKKLMLIGATGAMLSLVLIAVLYWTANTGVFLFLLFAVFMACFSSSIGPVKFIILSEIFPIRVRGKAVSLCVVCIWLTSAAVAQLFPMMQEFMNTGTIFLFFSVDVIALLVVVHFFLPETRGQTIEAIELCWLKPEKHKRI
jgi:sugar porter (SP) family MFS transporter